MRSKLNVLFLKHFKFCFIYWRIIFVLRLLPWSVFFAKIFVWWQGRSTFLKNGPILAYFVYFRSFHNPITNIALSYNYINWKSVDVVLGIRTHSRRTDPVCYDGRPDKSTLGELPFLKWIFLGSPMLVTQKSDEWKHHFLWISVTRFGEILPFWQNLQWLGQFSRVYLLFVRILDQL